MAGEGTFVGIKEPARLCERDNKRLWDQKKASFLSTTIFFSSSPSLPVFFSLLVYFLDNSVSQLKEYCNYILSFSNLGQKFLFYIVTNVTSNIQLRYDLIHEVYNLTEIL